MTSIQAITTIVCYRDPPTATKWLCQAFGFQHSPIAQSDDNTADQFSLSFGDSIILVCPLEGTIMDAFVTPPSVVGGSNTQVCYLAVPDLEGHRERAVAAGAKIEIDRLENDAGDRCYGCRDIEDHLWIFGTKAYSSVHQEPNLPAPRRNFARNAGIAAAVVLAIGGTLPLVGWRELSQSARTSIPSQSPPDLAAEHAQQVAALAQRTLLEAALREKDDQIQKEQSAGIELRSALSAAQSQLMHSQTENSEIKREMAEASTAKSAAEQAASEALATAQRERARAAQAKQSQDDLRLETARLEADSAALRREHEDELAQRSAFENSLREKDEQLVKEQSASAELRAALESAQSQLTNIRSSKDASERNAAEKNESGIADGTRTEVATTDASTPTLETGGLAAAKTPQPEIAALQTVPKAPQGGGSNGLGAADRGNVAKQQPSLGETDCAFVNEGNAPSLLKGSSARGAKPCASAKHSPESAKCFDKAMSGSVNWGDGVVWVPRNALTLCAGTRSASQTIDCFVKNIADGETWKSAIGKCRAAPAKAAKSMNAGVAGD